MPLPLLNLFTALGRPFPDTNHVIKCQGLYHYEACSFSAPLSPSSSLVCSSVFPCSPLGPRKLTSLSSRVWAGLGQWDVAARNERARRETVGDTSPSLLTWLQETISSPGHCRANSFPWLLLLQPQHSFLAPLNPSRPLKIVSSLKFFESSELDSVPCWQPYWYEAVT